MATFRHAPARPPSPAPMDGSKILATSSSNKGGLAYYADGTLLIVAAH
ncbi:MAG: hypothetical protein AVDCRST_MAG88-2045 [uncultured Thermomicrobiales bacterium]|uniref:Uncharacterized protein n=1 Tax=uncultured Thermomicrobiales bacterium TaxID=1645740 RepID=A0A6J4V6E6_9BACT|nr:MAG: hypothetical protein AVDCRST_MAG88-2045 [uncultured Thermomicrobiales bacterium]